MNRPFSLVLVYLLTASLTFAQSSTAPDAPKDPQALSIALRSLAVMGSGNLAPNQCAQATGTLTLHGNDDIVFPVVLKSLGTQLLRMELTTNKGLRLFIANTGHGIILQPDGTVRELVDDNMIVQRVNHVPALSLLAEVTQTGVAVEYVGNSQVDGSTVDIVAISLYSGSSVSDAQALQARTREQYYIDSKTGLVNRIDRVNYAENNPNQTQNLETHFSDYRQVSGVMVPFQQSTLADGKPYLDLVLTLVAFDCTFQAADFSLSQ